MNRYAKPPLTWRISRWLSEHWYAASLYVIVVLGMIGGGI